MPFRRQCEAVINLLFRGTQTTDNGKQNTYFSSLDNMVAQGNVLPVLYGEMRVGSRVVSQEISTADEGDGGQVVVIGR
ncbi:tail assembly protein [Escherichia coli]|nr:tail assembly protein [Escherichia coli]